MSKGIKLPLVLIFLALFLSIPVLFFYYIKDKNVDTTNVKGVQSEIPSKSGITVRVSSNGGTWDLHQFLCDDKEACLKTLNIGKPWGIVSGGVTKNYEFNIAANQKWESNFKYIKLFVRSSWGSMSRDFNPTVLNQSDLTETFTITSDGVSYKVILVPLEKINENSAILIDFRDF